MQHKSLPGLHYSRHPMSQYPLTPRRRDVNTRAAFIFFFALTLFSFSCKKSGPDFTFAFLTDIHVQPEKHAAEGFQLAIDNVNALKPDFVITGGDLVMDTMNQDAERAVSLYDLYFTTAANLSMPVHNTIGNHDHFGWSTDSDVDPAHPEFGKAMYRNRIGPTYQSFDFNGWHFLLLDSIAREPGGGYIGWIDAGQMEWISEDLKNVDRSTPIVISTHIPFITVSKQLSAGSLEPNSKGLVINNSKEVLTLFKEHNLKLVLQGHLHFLEEIVVGGIHFITGGAVCADWWDGPREKVEEGFVIVEVAGHDLKWRYVDFGWEANPE